MKVDAEIVEAINAERHAHDPGQAIITHIWGTEWERHCFGVNCRAPHDFRVVVAIGHQENQLPSARLALWQDDEDYMVPLTKPALAEIISDLRACLDALP